MIFNYPQPQNIDVDEWIFSDTSSRTIFEEDTYEEVGILDSQGNPMKFKIKKEPIGFIRFG